MKIKHLYIALSFLMALSMVLSACAPQAATATQVPQAQQTQEPVMTEAPTQAATAAPTEAPKTTRHGGWLDEIDYSVVDSASAISQIQAGAIDF